jgi:expansin (peptidoglycan-binding protein)
MKSAIPVQRGGRIPQRAAGVGHLFQGPMGQGNPWVLLARVPEAAAGALSLRARAVVEVGRLLLVAVLVQSCVRSRLPHRG